MQYAQHVQILLRVFIHVLLYTFPHRRDLEQVANKRFEATYSASPSWKRLAADRNINCQKAQSNFRINWLQVIPGDLVIQERGGAYGEHSFQLTGKRDALNKFLGPNLRLKFSVMIKPRRTSDL